MSNAFTERYASGAYSKATAARSEATAEWKAQQVVNLALRNRAELGNARSLLDIGCGDGILIGTLSRSGIGCDYVGCDLRPEAIDIARTKDLPKTTFVCGDAFALTSKHDLVTCLDVFEHVADYLGFLTKTRELGAHFIFHVPLDLSAFNVLEVHRLMDRRRRIGHLHYFSKVTAIATLEDCGYEVIDWRYTASGFENPWAKRHPWRYWPLKGLFAIAPDFAVRLFGEYSLLVLARPKYPT